MTRCTTIGMDDSSGEKDWIKNRRLAFGLFGGAVLSPSQQFEFTRGSG